MKNNITIADIEAGVKKRAAKKIALTYLGLTSFIVTYPYGFSLISKLLPEWIAWAPAALISILIYRFIDGDLADNLHYVEKTAGSPGTTRRRKVAKIAAGLLLIATASFTYVANYFVANTAIQPPSIEKLSEAEQANLSDYSDKSDNLSANLSEAKRNLSEARREGHKLVESARNSSNPEWAKRFGPHLAYAETQKARGKLSGAFALWYNSVRQAQVDSAQLVEAARANLSDLNRANIAHLSVTPDSLNSALDKAFLSELNWSTALRQKFTTFLVFTDGVAAVVIYFCHWWLCLFFRDGGRLPEAKASWQYHADRFLSERTDKLKQRLFPADTSALSDPELEPPKETRPPDLIPVRSTGDDWEARRRQEALEARLEQLEKERQDEARQAKIQAEQAKALADRMAREKAEAEARQAELIRQAQERADRLAREKAEAEARARQLAEEKARADRKEPTKDKPKPLSDKGSGNVSARIVGNAVEFDGKTYDLSEIAKFVDAAAKCYTRQFTSATDKGKKDNADRWKAALPVLKKLGYQIEQKPDYKVSITGGKTVKA